MYIPEGVFGQCKAMVETTASAVFLDATGDANDSGRDPDRHFHRSAVHPSSMSEYAELGKRGERHSPIGSSGSPSREPAALSHQDEATQDGSSDGTRSIPHPPLFYLVSLVTVPPGFMGLFPRAGARWSVPPSLIT